MKNSFGGDSSDGVFRFVVFVHNIVRVNGTKSNKNPIELNRTIGVRLGSAIERNRTSILL